MFKELDDINSRPDLFQYYSAEELWANDHTSKRMLEFHLNESIDISSRNKKFIDDSVDWIVSYFDVRQGTTICDFGCGPGLYTSRLAAKGADVTGIDFSSRSIEYAKSMAQKKGQHIDYVLQNYLRYVTDKKFKIITMIMCDFCALSPKQRKDLLKKFYNLLESNGSILLDVYTLNSFNEREEQSFYEMNLLNGFWAPEKYYGFLNTFKYDKEKVILDKYTIIEKNRVRIVYNWLQYFSKEALIKELEENNFQAENFYSDVAGNPYNPGSGEMAIIVKKAI